MATTPSRWCYSTETCTNTVTMYVILTCILLDNKDTLQRVARCHRHMFCCRCFSRVVTQAFAVCQISFCSIKTVLRVPVCFAPQVPAFCSVLISSYCVTQVRQMPLAQLSHTHTHTHARTSDVFHTYVFQCSSRYCHYFTYEVHSNCGRVPNYV